MPKATMGGASNGPGPVDEVPEPEVKKAEPVKPAPAPAAPKATAGG